MPHRPRNTIPPASAGLLDDVTGLYNARGLARRVREMGSQALRNRQSLACISVSCEPLENTREADVLPIVASTLERSTRPSDPVGRMSGPHFVVLTAGTHEGDVQRISARLRHAVEQALEKTGRPPASYRVRVGFEEISNLAYAPVEPMGLLARATNAFRGPRQGRGD